MQFSAVIPPGWDLSSHYYLEGEVIVMEGFNFRFRVLPGDHGVRVGEGVLGMRVEVGVSVTGVVLVVVGVSVERYSCGIHPILPSSSITSIHTIPSTIEYPYNTLSRAKL